MYWLELLYLGGDFNPEDKTSSFHARADGGVEEQRFGWIDNQAMKLLYCFGNTEEVVKIIKD